jgi:putative Ca2+/H+ antiporter (TMEM165/GDT1 family)
MMDIRILATVFATVFLAELGDKTQLATMLFAADREVSKWTVFAGASLALVATSALGVLVGGALSSVVSPRTLQLLAGAGFVGIGLWTVIKAV